GRRRILRLQGHELRDRLRNRDALPLEKHLPQQKRAVQLAQRHGTTAAFNRSRGESANSAGRSSSSTRCVTSRSQGYAPLARKPSAARTVGGVWWNDPRTVSSS